jgi:hypothetical protein
MLYATGDLRLRVDIDLLLRSGSGGWVRHRFLVDTGTEIATFPAHEAKQLGLILPARPAAVSHEQTGLEVRSGMLAFQIDGMGPTLYAVPCLFLGDPDAPPPPSTPPGGLPRKLLQPLALLDVLRFKTDKDPASIGARYGELVIESR